MIDIHKEDFYLIDEDIIRNIYNRIGDDYSKKVFWSRMIYSLSGDDKLLSEVRDDFKEVVMSDVRLKKYKEKLLRYGNGFYIYGSGMYARHMFELMPEIRPIGFIDSNPVRNGQQFKGYPVYDLDSFTDRYKGEKIVISSKPNQFDMMDALCEHGIKNEDIINGSILWDIIEGRQYFDLPNLPHVPDEVFADVGTLDGLSCTAFYAWNNDSGRCYCFEPDEGNREKTVKNLARYGIADYRLYDKGLWNETTELKFDARGMGESRIVDGDGSDAYILKISVAKMDDLLQNERITFIKMDIEGAEKPALEGAGNIIRDQKPKLAISVYHKKEDIWEIPDYILKLRDDYKLFFRHYCYWANGETVMYAI